MHQTPEFPDLLRLIEERSKAFRALVAAAPDLDVPVPTCPGWTLFDLAQHVGQGRLRWAAIVAAGPAEERPTGTALSDAVAAPRGDMPLYGSGSMVPTPGQNGLPPGQVPPGMNQNPNGPPKTPNTGLGGGRQ